MTAGSVEAPAPTLVLGLGNLLLSDDGVGLRLLADLRREAGENSQVEFVDGGTQGLALLGYVAGCPRLVILDAIDLGAPPGSVHVLAGQGIDQLGTRLGNTAHEGGALQILAMANLLGQAPGRVTIVGVEPALVRTGVGLSPAVESALPRALAEAKRILADMGRE
jgi:hydrogenase maturation protease